MKLARYKIRQVGKKFFIIQNTDKGFIFKMYFNHLLSKKSNSTASEPALFFFFFYQLLIQKSCDVRKQQI